jgi:ketosteroid isomerase-like protein
MLALLLAGGAVALSVGTSHSAETADEAAVWDLERAYWRYVQSNDLRSYVGLWHEAFLGWPSVSTTPVSKEHITDWITSQTTQGWRFQTVEVKPAAIRITGDVAMVYYWVTFQWLDKAGKGEPQKLRITHAWRRDGKGWQIIGGMSMPESASALK